MQSMLPVSSSSALPDQKIRRRRVQNACTHCRDRRVRCDRVQPVCSRCKAEAKTCKYTDHKARKVEFVEDRSAIAATPEASDSLPGTWRSVIEHQAGIVKNGDGSKKWAVAEVDEPSSSERVRLSSSAHLPLRALGDFFVSIVLDTLPAAQVCHTYFQSFLESVHPIVPVCHIPTLEQKYSTFRQNLKADSSIESLALMLAVLYTGGANSNPNHTELAAPFLTLYDTIFGSLDFASYQTRNASSSTQLLQAYIIMHTFQASYLAPFSAYGFLPLAIRFAQSLRLHTQPKNWGVVELEVGRRIWWHLVFTDIESTIATGLPPIIYPSSYTTELPSLYHDPTLDSKSTVAFSPMMVAVRGHFQWAHRMQIWFESLPSKDEVSGFKNLIETLVNSLPNIPANEWPRTYLKMQIDRAYCMLGLRFWQLDQYKGTGCQSEVVKTARSFLNHYLALSRMTTYGNFTWFIPHLVQPLHATIILLMHISTCSDLLVEEALSRPLLDTIFRTRIDRILSARIRSTKLRFKDDIRANPRYLILVELRKRVWKKVGWEYDGKGVDPWGGRTIEGVDNVAGVQSDAARLPSDHAIEDNKAAEMVLDQIPHIWSSTDSTGLEGLDNLLASDPMDLFQWDEWESLAADFFTN